VLLGFVVISFIKDGVFGAIVRGITTRVSHPLIATRARVIVALLARARVTRGIPSGSRPTEPK
jgi:hypothetical protein